MTELLAPVLRRGSAGPGTRRPLALNAAVAGMAAPVVALLLLWAAGLVAWFATDGGSHGTTRSVLRVVADGWLVAHGAHLDLGDGVVVTASPLGLTLACAWIAYRLGRWAGAASDVEDLRTAGLGAIVLGGTSGLVALVVAVLASTPGAAPGLGLAFLGGAVVPGLAGGLGLVTGAGLRGTLGAALPDDVVATARVAATVVVGMVAAGAALTTVAVAVRGAAVANVAEQLHLDAVGLVFSVLLTLAVAPNVALLAGSYLLGPGFAVGTDSVVSLQEVSLGAVPVVPVLGALPPEGWAPGWALLLLAAPLAVGLAAGHTVGRLPGSPTRGVGRGVVGGALGATALAVLVSQAGGSIGPGRMTETGAGFWSVLPAALLVLVPATVLGVVVASWRAPRDRRSEEEADAAGGDHPSAPAERLPEQRLSAHHLSGKRVPEQRPSDPRLPGQRTAAKERAEDGSVGERR